MKNRRIWAAVAVLVILVAVGLVYAKRGKSKPDAQKLANEIAAGKQISLPGGEKVQVNSPSAQYFALPAGPERVAFLDKMIDQQEEMRKKIASGEIKLPDGMTPATIPAGTKPHFEAATGEKHGTEVTSHTSPDGSAKTMTVRLNSDDLSPAFRAQMQEFAGALRNRRKERGLDPDAPMMFIRNEVHGTPK